MLDLNGLKVGFIAGTLGAGGAERQLFYAVTALRDAGAHVQVLYLHPGGPWGERLAEREIPLRWVGRPVSRPLRLAGIIREVRGDRPAILHSQHFFTNAYAVAAARLLGIHEVGAIRSDPRRAVRLNGPLAGYVNLHAPRAIAVNSRAAIRQALALGVASRRLHYLPNVVDVEEFQPGNGHRRPYIHIAVVGRLLPEKRFDRFLALLARVQQRSRTRVRGIVAGAGPQRRTLEQLARRLGLASDDVEFRGFVADVAGLYREADILVSTSDHEGTPNVILEAMAAGLPVVATTAGGTAEVVCHGETGYLVEPDDAEALAAAVTELSEDPTLRRRMGDAGREHVSTAYSLARLPVLLAELYDRILSCAPS